MPNIAFLGSDEYMSDENATKKFESIDKESSEDNPEMFTQSEESSEKLDIDNKDFIALFIALHEIVFLPVLLVIGVLVIIVLVIHFL